MKKIFLTASLDAALGLASAGAMAQQQTYNGSFQASDYSPPVEEAGARPMAVSAQSEKPSRWHRSEENESSPYSAYHTGVRSFDNVYFGQ